MQKQLLFIYTTTRTAVVLDIIIFNVEHGQSVFFYPQDSPAYGMFVDCGNTKDFNPIDCVLAWGLLPKDQMGRPVLSNLTLTNYDHDHFSGLPYLMSKALIATIRFARNITSQELISIKPEKTDALSKVCTLQSTYIYPASFHVPPYAVATFSLPRHCFPNGECDTNNLSQIVFVRYGGSVICISGDVEKEGWEKLLTQPEFVAWLRATNVLVAAHHGRINGYAEEIFDYCSPECVILSDKKMTHGTQEGMSQVYANRVVGKGIFLTNHRSLMPRKALTTRNDGHIWIQFSANGTRVYKNIV